MVNRFLLGALIAFCFGISSGPLYADRGVGVTLGSISIDERLAKGGGYSLPTLGVINTGDEAGEYEVVISYHQGSGPTRTTLDLV